MRRPVIPEHKFDVDRFAELLKSAQGNRSQTDFAKECGISVAFMCKNLNKKLDKAPTPPTIKKIADHAANGVTFEALLDAAGYDPAKHMSITSSNTLKISAFEKLAIATITASLSQSNFKWTTSGSVKNNDIGHDFTIDILNESISRWYFDFIYIVPSPTFECIDMTLQKHLYMLYTKLLMTCEEPNSKYSLVTNSKTAFEKLIHFHPYMLAMHVSVILIDVSTLTVIKEENLKTAINDDGSPDITCAQM